MKFLTRPHRIFRSLILASAFLAIQAWSGDVMVHQPWARALPEVTKIGAVYLVIMNQGNETDRVMGGSTPVAAKTEIHNNIHKDGVMKMEKQDFVEIPAGNKVEFKPGGLHVMLMGLTAPMTAGTEFPLILEFEKAGTIEVTVKVMDMEGEGMDHSGHTQQPE